MPENLPANVSVTLPTRDLAAAWAAANLHASFMDSNSRHSINGLTAKMAMGLLTTQQTSRIMEYWAWWESIWAHYEDVRTQIAIGVDARFDPAIPGPCPWTIWQIKEA